MKTIGTLATKIWNGASERARAMAVKNAVLQAMPAKPEKDLDYLGKIQAIINDPRISDVAKFAENEHGLFQYGDFLAIFLSYRATNSFTDNAKAFIDEKYREYRLKIEEIMIREPAGSSPLYGRLAERSEAKHFRKL
jgi:hypothetical protein